MRARSLAPLVSLLLAACSSGGSATVAHDAGGGLLLLDARAPGHDAGALDATTHDARDASPPEARPPGDAGADGSIHDAVSGVDVACVRTHTPLPNVPNTGGHTLVSPRIVTVTASNDALATQLDAFSDAFPGSAVWGAVSAEYGLGAITSAAHLTGPSMSGAYTEAQLLAYVSAAIANDAGPQPDGTTIYALYLPDGASLADFSFGACGGYHAGFPLQGDSTGDQLAAVERCTPAHYETELGNATNTMTHELVESATDPLDEGYNLGETPMTPWTASPWQSWALSGHVELADLCEGTWLFEQADGGPDGGWEYQRIWSNAGAADGGAPCIPATPTPYFNASTAEGWYALPADGGAVTIPVVPWSAAHTTDWLLSAHEGNANATGTLGPMINGGGVVVTSSLGIGNLSCGVNERQAANECAAVTLTVSAPAGTLSGDWAVIALHSFREDSTCWQPLSEDYYHFVPIGIYVP